MNDSVEHHFNPDVRSTMLIRCKHKFHLGPCFKVWKRMYRLVSAGIGWYRLVSAGTWRPFLQRLEKEVSVGIG